MLALLNREDMYGYDISEVLSRRIQTADGTVYPLLRKLKDEGMVKTYVVEESNGPPRKYYTLTELGREEFFRSLKEWNEFSENVKIIIGGNQ